ncbi:MAG: glucose 1-dehydrogenase [Nitrososphaerales archaeon]|jgi:NAD(P)-dependent dehydrogenase (short-subunit alcohol dehydrogenase family)
MGSTLNGKVTIVTGAASGIGRGAAMVFAASGAKVVVADINEEGGRKTVEEIRGRGGTAIWVRTDVSSAADAKNCVARAVEEFGRLDCLFSNAGFNPTGTVVETTEELWDRLIDVNLKGMFLMCKYSIPEMKKAGKGSIVCTASVDGVLAIRNEAAYIASKGGIISLVKAMALDHALENIRVNCILPGAIRTALYEKFIAENPGIEDQAKEHPMNRIGEPEEVAEVAMFLLSDAPSFMTGAIVPVDGGYSAAKT